MTQPAGHHLAEFNIGILKYDWDHPGVQDFVNGLDRVNRVAHRSPGFVWMLGADEMDAEQRDPDGALGGNPRTASTLSVWTDATKLEHFVWNTVHKQFYDRKAEWYDALDALRLVMWWVPIGHRPTISEAMARFHKLDAEGDSVDAFGWAHLQQARLWQTRGCSGAAA